MTPHDAKAAFERSMFLDFAAAARLPVDPSSVQSRPPPEPDILCEVEGRGPVAFELVNLADTDLARAEARASRVIDGEGTWFSDPTMQLIEVKLFKKSYTTPHPMELVAYGGDPMFPYDVWEPTFADGVRAAFDVAVGIDPSPGKRFERVWVVNLEPRARRRPIWLVHPPL